MQHMATHAQFHGMSDGTSQYFSDKNSRLETIKTTTVNFQYAHLHILSRKLGLFSDTQNLLVN